MECMLISVIIPVYNTPECCLEKCINSVLSQSYKNFEVIIIDDGSNNNIAKWLDNKSVCDNRINVKHTENSGVSSARNSGIELAKGEYITFIDSDDYVEQYFLEKSLYYIQKYDLDIVTGKTYIINNEKVQPLEKNLNSEINLIYTTKNILEALLLNYTKLENDFVKIVQAPWCKVFKVSLIGDSRFISGLKYGEDAVFNSKIFSVAKKVGVVNSHWYNYVISDFSAMAIHDERKMLDYLNQHICYIYEIFSWGNSSGNKEIELISYRKIVNIINDILFFYVNNYENKCKKNTKNKLKELLYRDAVQYSIQQIEQSNLRLPLNGRINLFFCKKKYVEILILKQKIIRLLKNLKK